MSYNTKKSQNITETVLRRLAILAGADNGQFRHGWKARLAREIGVDRSTPCQWINKDKIPGDARDSIHDRGFPLSSWYNTEEKVPETQHQAKLTPQHTDINNDIKLNVIRVEINEREASERILKLLEDSNWNMTALAEAISRYTSKPVDRRLLKYHLDQQHLKREWYKGIQEYFGQLTANYALFGAKAKDDVTMNAKNSNADVSTHQIAFVDNLTKLASELLIERRHLIARLQAKKRRLKMLKELVVEGNIPPHADEETLQWWKRIRNLAFGLCECDFANHHQLNDIDGEA